MNDKSEKRENMKYEKNLMQDRRFWPIFWTQFSGAFNDNVFKNAIVILITFKAFSLGGLKTEQMVALCGGIFILPFFLFSAYAGQISDKYAKHTLMYWTKVWEIVAMVLGTVGFISENIYILLGTLFFMGLQSTFFGPVKFSILPELINEDELVHGNALIEMGTFVSILLGTILGGVLMSIPESGKYYVSGCVIVCAVIGTYFSAKVNKLEAVDVNLKTSLGIFKPTWEIIKIGREVKSIWLSILAISWFWFLGAALLSIFPVYVKDVVKGDQQVVTFFLALFSIGVALGSFICEKLSKQRLELGLVPFGSIGITLFIFDLYLVGEPVYVASPNLQSVSSFLSYGISWRIVIDLLMLSVFSGFFIVPLYTFIQKRSRKEVRSRVIASNNILNAFFMVASSVVLTGLYAVGCKTTELFLIFGIFNAIVAVYVYSVVPEFLLRFTIMILSRIVYRLNVKGLNNIPDEGPAVLVCNHISFVDWLIIAAGIKRPVRFVMHHSFMKIPFINYFFKAGKAIPIAGQKEDPELMEKAFAQISQQLREGELICIFPEGKISSDGMLNPYKPGIERIIQTDQVVVIPMVLKGLWGSFFSRAHDGKAISKPSVIPKRIWSQVTLEIGESVPPDCASAKNLEEKTMEMIGVVKFDKAS